MNKYGYLNSKIFIIIRWLLTLIVSTLYAHLLTRISFGWISVSLLFISYFIIFSWIRLRFPLLYFALL